VRNVQEKLLEEGIDPGPVDGILGPQTRAGLREFQRENGLTVTGRMDNETLSALGLEVTTTLVPRQTRIDVRLDEYLDSGKTQVGEQFWMTVSESVVTGKGTAIPVGSRIRGTVTDVQSAGRPQRSGRMVLRPDFLSVRGESILIDGIITAEGRELKGEGSIEEDLKKIGIAAGLGAVLGGIIEGSKGALAGLLIGGGGTFLATKGEQVELLPETPLIVQLQEAIRVPLLE